VEQSAQFLAKKPIQSDHPLGHALQRRLNFLNFEAFDDVPGFERVESGEHNSALKPGTHLHRILLLPFD
jgi:hypothetical protein